MEFTETVPVAVATGDVDLAEWIFGLSDEEYRAVAVGHHAMGVIGGEKRLGLVNVEQIAGTLIVQHYCTRTAEAGHVSFVSEASEGSLLRAVPFTMKVWWDMAIKPGPKNEASLNCRIGFDAPAWVTAAGTLVRNNHQVHRHLIEETAGFARDLDRKFGRITEMGGACEGSTLTAIGSVAAVAAASADIRRRSTNGHVAYVFRIIAARR